MKPKLLAFDLDYTLWPFWVDTHVNPPFRRDQNGDVCDSHGSKIKYYSEVPEVLQYLQNEGYILAVASRTSEIDGANQLLKLFGWEKYFTYKEIYPGCKITHFKRFKTKSGIEFTEMLFFDDEYRNKVDLEKIGVKTKMVKNGITRQVVKAGLEEFASTSAKNLK